MSRKDTGKDCAENINEMIFYLKNNYSNHNREQACVDNIPQENGCSISFEEMSNRLKTYSKSITDVENTTLKNVALFGGWLSKAFLVYRRDRMSGKALPNRFEDWIQRECGIKKQTICNYRNLYDLASVAPKLFNFELIQRILLKTMIFLLITLKATIHRGIMLMTAVVKIAIHTLQTQNVL